MSCGASLRGDIRRSAIAGIRYEHSAALAGHVLQESGGDPTNVNKAEDAHGLLQWRLDRWQNLQNFAKERGLSPTDPQVQLDFIGREMAGPEAKAGRGFMAAGDVQAASAALKPYIRFGDASAPTRLNNAVGLLRQYNGDAGPVIAGAAPQDPVSPVDPTSTASPPVSLSAPVGALASAPTPAQTLADAGGKLTAGGGQQQQQPEFLPLQPIQMPQPMLGQSQQIAQSLAKAYGWT